MSNGLRGYLLPSQIFIMVDTLTFQAGVTNNITKGCITFSIVHAGTHGLNLSETEHLLMLLVTPVCSSKFTWCKKSI